MKVSACIAAALGWMALCVQGDSFRSYGPWTSSQLGGGGYLQRVAFSPSHPQRLYLATDVGGAYRSDDAGHSWHMLHGALPQGEGSTQVRGIVVHPTRPDCLLLATGNPWDIRGIYRSDDAGASFELVFKCRFEGNDGTRAAGPVLVSAPDGSETVYACPIGLGPHRSDDFGKTWHSLNLPNVYAKDFVVDRTNPHRLWLNAASRKASELFDGKPFRAGLFFSEDGGASWQCLDLPESPKEMVQDPQNASLLHGLFATAPQFRFSTDDGRTWLPYKNPELLPPPGGNARADGTYAALATGPNFVVAAGHGGTFYRLPAGGDTWERLPPVLIHDEGWYAGHKEPVERHFGAALGFLAISPHNPNHWLFTDWYACYLSPDAGLTWNLSIQGIEMVVTHCLAQDPAHPERVHVGLADIGYFQSNDGGQSFGKDSWGRHRGISNNIKCISVCASTPNVLYATGPITWKWVATQTFRSTDGGAHWKRPAQRGLPSFSDADGARCNTIAVHPKNPDEVYLAVSGPVRPGEGGIYRSTNGGEDWTWFSQGLPEESLFRRDIWTKGPELAISPNGTLLAVSHDSGRVFRRSPEDSQWQALSLPGRSTIAVADPLAPDRFYIARQKDGLFQSHDGARSWHKVLDENVSWIAVDSACAGRLAVSCNGEILLSTDAAASWKPLPGTPPHRSWRQVLCFAGNRLIAGTAGSGLFFRDL